MRFTAEPALALLARGAARAERSVAAGAEGAGSGRNHANLAFAIGGPRAGGPTFTIATTTDEGIVGQDAGERRAAIGRRIAHRAVVPCLTAIRAVACRRDAAAAVDAVVVIQTGRASRTGLAVAGLRGRSADAPSVATILVTVARRVVADTTDDVAQLELTGDVAIDGGEAAALRVAAGIARREGIAVAADGLARRRAPAARVLEAEPAAALVARGRNCGPTARARLPSRRLRATRRSLFAPFPACAALTVAPAVVTRTSRGS